jgi:hypothetical protein
MYRLDLPLSLAQRLAGPLLVLGGGILILLSPILFPWRIAALLLALLIGGLSWGSYLVRRPCRLDLKADGGILCRCADGREATVCCVLTGVVHPRLLTARLTLDDGTRADLWVPGAAIDSAGHHALRTALLAYREDTQDGAT